MIHGPGRVITRFLLLRDGYDPAVAARRADAAFQALGDPNRRAILEELGRGERSVAQLTRRVGISQPAVSRHLRLLKGAGLVEDHPEGAKNIYRLRREGAEAVRAYVESLWGQAAVRFRLAADNTSRPKRR